MNKNIHAELMLLWAMDQNNNPSQVWQYSEKFLEEDGDNNPWIDIKIPEWFHFNNYRRKPREIISVYGSKYHIDQQAQMKADVEAGNSQMWQWKYVNESTWQDSYLEQAQNFIWGDGYEYRRKPAPLPHEDLRVQWQEDQELPPPSVWQYELREGTGWVDLRRGREPRWFESRNYRRKPEVSVFIPEKHRESFEKWTKDQRDNPSQEWQHRPANSTGEWYPIDFLGIGWSQEVDYRRTPLLCFYAMCVGKNGEWHRSVSSASASPRFKETEAEFKARVAGLDLILVSPVSSVEIEQ